MLIYKSNNYYFNLTFDRDVPIVMIMRAECCFIRAIIGLSIKKGMQ